MDATAALFCLSLLLLVGIYGIYWVEGHRHPDVAVDPSGPTDGKT